MLDVWKGELRCTTLVLVLCSAAVRPRPGVCACVCCEVTLRVACDV